MVFITCCQKVKMDDIDFPCDSVSMCFIARTSPEPLDEF